MKRIILCLSLFAFFGSQAQQINPVPDYVFSNKMSVGRNAVTDTAAYFSIGPRYGAIRGMMPPMVTDTASMSATKRNGLLIFSIQKNKYLYWDSVGAKWAEMAGTAGSAITGSGVAGYMPEFTTSTNLDTTRLYHSAGRFAIGSTTTTNGVFNVIGGTTYLEGNLSFGAADRTISNISNNVLAFGTNNTERMRIGANGDVAIGTTNADPFTRGDDRRIAMDASGISSTANIALSLNAGSSAGRGAQLYLGVGGTRHFEISSNSVEQGISAISNTYIKILTNNTERMRLKADGELLIGTTTDAGAYALQVAGSIYNTEGAVLAATSGNVGIKITNPSVSLDVLANSASNSTVAARFRGNVSTNNNTQIRFYGANAAADQWAIGNAVATGDATRNFDIFDLVASTNRLRIKDDGEILVNTTTDAGAYALQVAGSQYVTGSAVFDPTATGSNYMYMGTTTTRSISGLPNGALQITGNAGNTGGILIAGQLSNNSSGDFLQFIKSRGTSNVVVQNGDQLGGIMWSGADGTNYIRAASIMAYVDAAPGTNDMPARIEFRVTPDGSTVPTYRMALNNAGELIIQDNPTDAGNYKLQVDGAIYNTTTITTGAPTGGSIKPWRLGEAATVSPTSPNRTIRVEIDGTVYYIHAKTTND